MSESPGERRRPEASALRGFFQEQWDQLLRLLLGSSRAGEVSSAELERALEALVDGTDGRVRMVFSYRKRLREGVRVVLEHVERVVAQLPPARVVSRGTFHADPLINAMFPGPDDIPRVFSESAEVQDFLARALPPGSEQGFSVLAATPQQKRVLGMELDGDRVIRDVQQTVLLFTERRAKHPGADEAQVRLGLSRYLFDTVVAMLRARLSGEHLGSVGPDEYLGRLSLQLHRAGELLRLTARSFTLTKQGVLLPDDAGGPVNRIQFLEMDLAEFGSSVVLLACFPVAEVTRRERLLHASLRGLDPFSR